MDFLCLDFINTQCDMAREPYQDPLQDQRWLNSFLNKWQLGDYSITKPRLESLIPLRTLLFKSINALCNGKKLSKTQLQEINRYLSLIQVHHELIEEKEEYKINLQSKVHDWNIVPYSIAVSFAKLLSEAEMKRIRQCENPECNWFFYDESKNYTRRWCGNTCASRIKVRRFREKQKGIQNIGS